MKIKPNQMFLTKKYQFLVVDSKNLSKVHIIFSFVLNWDEKKGVVGRNNGEL